MLEIKGKHNTAKVFTDNIDDNTIAQVLNLCNQNFLENSHIRIMPDTHVGKGCVIGTTLKIKDKVIPNLVGVDIGCGMLTVVLGNMEIDFGKLDDFIRKNIPHGFAINQNPKIDYEDNIEKLRCFREIPKSSKEFNRALGSLGGGNHFIEVNENENGCKYLVIHCGSRNLGHQVASYYQNKAYEYHSGQDDQYEIERQELVKNYKEQGRRKEIRQALIGLKNKHKKECTISKELCYLEGDLMEDYLHDMKIAQEYANVNRDVIGKRIVEECLDLNYDKLQRFHTVHNYIDIENMILRKGAISANKNELVIIPINMRDGSILALGKGNPDWNFSAPHGAGRIMSRSVAKENISFDEFKNTMSGVWSTSVRESTLDEAPMAYKPIESILNNVGDTLSVISIIKPVYNFKSS